MITNEQLSLFIVRAAGQLVMIASEKIALEYAEARDGSELSEQEVKDRHRLIRAEVHGWSSAIHALSDKDWDAHCKAWVKVENAISNIKTPETMQLRIEEILNEYFL